MARLSLSLIGVVAALSLLGSFSSVVHAQEKVVVYTVLPEPELNRRLDEEFTRRTGITVDRLNVPAVGTLAARIRSEKDRPRGDVFASAPVDFQDSLAKDGLLEKYVSPAMQAGAIAKGYADPNGFWTGWFGMTTCIFWNKDRYKEAFAKGNVPPPATWDDLLKTDYKGQIITANPQTSAIGYVLVATQIFRLGEPAAWTYEEKLSRNVAQFTPSAPLTVTLVERGEAPIGIFWLADVLTSKYNRSQPLEVVVPPKNVVNIWAASIIRGGPNPEAAKKYIDFLESDFAQETNAKYGFRNPLNPTVKPPAGAPSLADLETVNYDNTWATQNMDRVRKTWAEKTGN